MTCSLAATTSLPTLPAIYDPPFRAPPRHAPFPHRRPPALRRVQTPDARRRRASKTRSSNWATAPNRATLIPPPPSSNTELHHPQHPLRRDWSTTRLIATEIVPAAAEKWEISPDGRTYTFHLRKGLKWSNGDPLTSADFLYGFRRLIEPPLGAELAVYADWVVGGKDLPAWARRTISAPSASVRRTRSTFEITLNQRAPYYLGILAGGPFLPGPPRDASKNTVPTCVATAIGHGPAAWSATARSNSRSGRATRW